jgi:phosphoribosylanthranilate isomerase
MARVRIKICGVRSIAEGEAAARLGADAVGLNLYGGSRRNVTPELARKIAQSLPAFVEPVVLFVNEPLAQAMAVAEPISGTIQWHGDEPPLPPLPPWRFIPAFPVVDRASLTAVTGYLDRCRAAGRVPAAVLLDGHATGQYGGTGNAAPWQLLAEFDPGVPVILAGGLTPDNVAEAIRIVHPFGVDVASGVESEPGSKDVDKVSRFIKAVLDADLAAR